MEHRLAQSPLRLAAGFGDTPLQRHKAAHKYRVPERETEAASSTTKPKGSRKRRLLPLTPLAATGGVSVPVSVPPPVTPTEKARKAFEAALRRRDFAQVLWLLTSGDVPATYETHGGETALLAAIDARDADAFRLLMESGVSIDAPNRHGFTPLMKAIAAAAPFAEASAASRSRRRRKPTRTPLASLSTVSNNDWTDDPNDLPDQHDDHDAFDNRMVACVLAYNPNLHARDAAGQTALDWAKRTHNAAACTQLVDHQRQRRDMHDDFADRAARHSACVALLTRHDALAYEMEQLLRVPLPSEARLLQLLRDAPIELQTRATLDTALADYAALATTAATADAVSRAFVDDHFVERETRDGWTPLTKAAACGFTEALQRLLALGADPNHETARHAHTALTWACYCGHEGVVLALLRDPRVDVARPTRERKTALIHAVANRQRAVVQHLLRAMHARCVDRAGGKQTFHHHEDAVRARQRTPTLTGWAGTRPVSSAGTAAGGRRKPAAEEWHDAFLAMLHATDASGRDALAYATAGSATVGIDGSDNDCNAIRQALQHALQQATDHAAHVATHQARTLPTPCRFAGDGCAVVAPRDLLPRHELHECPKRRVTCERCGDELVFDTGDTHDRVACPRRRVACVNRAGGCDVLVEVCEAEAHARDHCRKRLVPCRLGCGQDATLTFDTRDTHEATLCAHRLVPCPLACDVAPMRASETRVHTRKHCVKRLVPCRGGTEGTGGCGQLVRVDDMALHVTTLCVARRVACKWTSHGCCVALGGAGSEGRHHHEERECPFRLVACRHAPACPATAMLACFADEHYAWQCSYENVSCPHACGIAPLPRHAMDAHTQSDAGDCASRPTRCRLDLCGKTLRLFDHDEHIDNGDDGGGSAAVSVAEAVPRLTSDATARPEARVAMRALRQRVERVTAFLTKLRLCHDQDEQQGEAAADEDTAAFWHVAAARAVLLAWLQPLHDELTNELTCLERARHAVAQRVRVLSFDTATQCHLVEWQRDGRAVWLNLRGREYDVELPPAPPGSATNSATGSDVALRFGCNWLAARDLSTHEEHDCALRLVPCPLACGQKLPAHGVAPHLARRCNLRNAPCRLGCGAVLPFISLGDHELSQCEKRQVTCEHCHVTLPHHALDTHLATLCQHVPRRCRLGCGALVAAAQCATHELDACPKRLVPCPQCDALVFVSERDTHANSECALRVYGPCDAGCGVTLRVNERAHHLLFDCALRELPCPQCHAVVTWRALAQHKAQLCPLRNVMCRRGCGTRVRECDTATHEDTDCAQRLVPCPNQCGESVPRATCHVHVTLQCTMRVVPCPHGCGDSLFVYQCEAHDARCRQRLCRCGNGATHCARPIRLWVRDRALVTCQAHGETGLLWAIKRHDDDLVAYFVQAVASTELDREGANGFSPLAAACALGNLEIVKTLLRGGADVNVETSRGRTALREAVMARDPEVVALLLTHRARVAHVNRHGQHVVALAESLAVASTASADDDRATRVLALLRDAEALERDQRALFTAIACSDYAYVASLLQYSSTVHGSGRDTEQMLQQQLVDAQTRHAAVAHDVDESVALLNESIADTEAKTTATQRLRERVADCATQLSTVDVAHDASLAASSGLESSLLAQIQAITALDIAALLNAPSPPPAACLVVMKSICLLCGVLPRGRRHASEYTDLEWWKTAQALLMDRTLLRKLRAYRQQPVAPDVMAKVRRECLRTDAFAAIAVESPAVEEAEGDDTDGDKTRSVPLPLTEPRAVPPALPRRGALAGDILGRLATWVRGVETEYKHQHTRATLVHKKRRLAVSLGAHETGLATTAFEAQVATRSLPARQQEVAAAQQALATATLQRTAAEQRVRVWRLLQRAALNGHTPLSFACAVGNDAMVHMLLTHGASAGPRRDDREACAALIQLTFREARYRRTRDADMATKSRSDRAVDALVRSVAQTFLLGHYRRKRRDGLQTHRVPLHEAVYNGHASVVALLLAQPDVSLWQLTHVFPMRAVPGATDRVRGDPTAQRDLERRGGWTLVPLTGMAPSDGNADGSDDGNPRAVETTLAPMTLEQTLHHALVACDSATFARDAGGWCHGTTRYSETQRVVETALARAHEQQATQRHDVLARKQVVRKTRERATLHAALDHAIGTKAFTRVAQLLDDGAFADYETIGSGLTALSAACMDETLLIANSDGVVVRPCALLLDRTSGNRPSVDFESSTGRTALSTAATWGATLCAQELLDRGANVNYATRQRGETALMVAARSGQTDVVAFLLRHRSINVFLQDHRHQTALDHALAVGAYDAQRLLAQAMNGGVRTRVFASERAVYGVCQWGCGFMAAVHDYVAVGGSGSGTAGAIEVEHVHPLATHERDVCPKRLVPCPLGCTRGTDNGETTTTMLWAERVTAHTRHECARRLVTCAQPKCGAQIEARDVATHDQDVCEWRVVACACGERMAFAKHVLHAANACPQRLVSCPLGCLDQGNGLVTQLYACDLKQHERCECVLRRVRCRNGCAAASALLAKDREVHETERCALRRVECKWRCGETNVLAHAQLHHETTECLAREVSCPHKCGALVPVLALETHTLTDCPHRNTVCTLGCGRKVPLHTMARHVASECRRRVVACPQGCGVTMEESEVAGHTASQCVARLTACSLCGVSGIVQSALAIHRDTTCRMRVVQCRFACYATQPLRAYAQNQHEQFECSMRPVLCPLGCGETMVAHATKRHEKHCVMRLVACHSCGAEMREKDRSDHEQQYCANGHGKGGTTTPLQRGRL